MTDIHVLPPVLANRIAAGEVVERPASIVKELVENAIDAGSDSISIAITDGGISSITVSDNGCGIMKDQCATAFLRHATSKISTTDDLSSIDSLGFRGEALASISAVSSVTLTTRTEESEVGNTIRIDSGETVFIRDIVCPRGTTVIVENLFAKVPARLRFLKSSRYEAGYCADYISRMILAHPEITFRYSQDGKTVYETYGDGNLKNAIFSLYGSNIYGHLRELNFDDGYLKITGYIGTQEISHQNRTHESFFVNGRYIRSSSLSSALESSYLTKIMVGKYPFGVLHLIISPREIDVNVHPSKTQIRFANEARVCSAVTNACTGVLKDAVIPVFNHSTVSNLNEHFQDEVRVKPVLDIDQIIHKQESNSKNEFEYKSVINKIKTDHAVNSYKDDSSYQYSSFHTIPEKSDLPEFSVESNVVKSPINAKYELPQETHEDHKMEQASLAIPADYSILGCAFNAYWFVEYDRSLYVIDQHAACERRLYEMIMEKPDSFSSQSLIMPATVHVQPNEFSAINENRHELEKIGFIFKENGIFSFAIDAVPVLNGVQLSPDFLIEAASFAEKGKGLKGGNVFYESLVSASCKHAIKAGERITTQEIRQLIDSFIKNGTPLTCPHGRPVVVEIKKQEIEKNFKRIL